MLARITQTKELVPPTQPQNPTTISDDSPESHNKQSMGHGL